MRKHLFGLWLQLLTAKNGFLFIVKKPLYILLSLLGVLFASTILLWSLNLDLVAYILFDAPISIGEKTNFFYSVYRDMFTVYPSIHAVGIVVFSVLFGINFSLLLFVVRNQGLKNIPKKSGLGGTMFAVFASGCVACGTSLFSPILAFLGAGSTVFLRDVSLWSNWIASALLIYSVVKLAQIAASLKVANEAPTLKK